MTGTLADRLAQAVTEARRRALTFQGPTGKDQLPWAVIAEFDEGIRGNVERDRRIEDERDRVLIAAVKLAETPADEPDEVTAARTYLMEAIDFLEQAVLRFGIVNRQGMKLGLVRADG